MYPSSKYQFKPYSSQWFSAAFAAATEISFFVCTNKINFLNLKESSDRLLNVVKGFLKLPKLCMVIKQKSL